MGLYKKSTHRVPIYSRNAYYKPLLLCFTINVLFVMNEAVRYHHYRRTAEHVRSRFLQGASQERVPVLISETTDIQGRHIEIKGSTERIYPAKPVIHVFE